MFLREESKMSVSTPLASMSKRVSGMGRGSSIPSSLRAIASKGGFGMDEAMEAKSVGGSSYQLTPYLCYCKKCGKISPITSKVELADLCKKVFCPECASDLFRKKRSLTDELEKMNSFTSEQISLAATEHERKIEELEAEIAKQKEKITNVRQGILVLEEELGTGIILRKEEVYNAVFEHFIFVRNRKKNKKREGEAGEGKIHTLSTSSGNVGIGPVGDYDEEMSNSDELDSICKRIFNDRIRAERATEEAIIKKGF